MFMHRKDDTWPISIITLCLVIWLWVFTGCAVKEPVVPGKVTPKAEVTHEVPQPQIGESAVPENQYTCPNGVPIVVLRQDYLTVIYGYMRPDQTWALYMVTNLNTRMDMIVEAWVDVAGDGYFEEHFTNESDLLEKYPNPCSAVPTYS